MRDAAPAGEPFFDLVRTSCARVAKEAGSVFIDRERLRRLALSLTAATHFPGHDPDWHFLAGERETTAYFLTLDTVNFGSGWFPWLRKRAPRSGYFTIASHLADRFRKEGAPTADELAEMSAEAAADLFGQRNTGAEVAELMELFARALRDLGELLLLRYEGDFLGMVEDAGRSADRLARILTEMPLFRDTARYRGGEVHFYKRAQIASQDLALAFGGRGPGEFHDLDRLTIFADNLVPHVLRVDGILRYDPALAALIDGEEPLPAGSEAEVELRGCAVHAVELMAEILREEGRPLPPRVIDFMLWSRGQDPFYKGRPRHRTKSAFY